MALSHKAKSLLLIIIFVLILILPVGYGIIRSLLAGRAAPVAVPAPAAADAR